MLLIISNDQCRRDHIFSLAHSLSRFHSSAFLRHPSYTLISHVVPCIFSVMNGTVFNLMADYAKILFYVLPPIIAVCVCWLRSYYLMFRRAKKRFFRATLPVSKNETIERSVGLFFFAIHFVTPPHIRTGLFVCLLNWPPEEYIYATIV